MIKVKSFQTNLTMLQLQFHKNPSCSDGPFSPEMRFMQWSRRRAREGHGVHSPVRTDVYTRCPGWSADPTTYGWNTALCASLATPRSSWPKLSATTKQLTHHLITGLLPGLGYSQVLMHLKEQFSPYHISAASRIPIYQESRTALCLWCWKHKHEFWFVWLLCVPQHVSDVRFRKSVQLVVTLMFYKQQEHHFLKLLFIHFQVIDC